jgi:uncharacterized protein (DUF1778 family)
MNKPAQIKRDRMHLRVDAATKRKLERAAAFEDKSVSDFVLSNAVAAAERVIDRGRTTTLSEADWDAFYAALAKPPKPNAALMEAVRRYRDVIK